MIIASCLSIYSPYFLKAPVLKSFGRNSYVIYLIHYSWIRIFEKVMQNKVDSENAYSIITKFLFTLVLSYLCSVILLKARGCIDGVFKRIERQNDN